MGRARVRPIAATGRTPQPDAGHARPFPSFGVAAGIASDDPEGPAGSAHGLIEFRIRQELAAALIAVNVADTTLHVRNAIRLLKVASRLNGRAT